MMSAEGNNIIITYITIINVKVIIISYIMHICTHGKLHTQVLPLVGCFKQIAIKQVAS